MKQVVQDYWTGKLRLEEVSVPICRPKGVLVRTAYSVVSAGTERMKVSQARMNPLRLAIERKDKLDQVLRSVKQNGIRATYSKVRDRLGAMTSLGYSVAGIVEEVGSGLDEFRVGDRVACAGEGYASHAEFVYVPRNLCAAIPDGVEMRDAALSTIGAIAINGVRQAKVGLGDCVLVIGLGLVGQLAAEILKAAGCRVIATDRSAERVAHSAGLGLEGVFLRDDPRLEEAIRSTTGGAGVDAVYVAASANTSDPMHLAGQVARDRGVVVVVGMVNLTADWRTYYGKELSVVMARSYGPGRYDPQYEQKGIDYPIGHVRWTERRNLQEFLRLLADGRIRVGDLACSTVPFKQAPDVYDWLCKQDGKNTATILFEYPTKIDSMPHQPASQENKPQISHSPRDTVGIGVIGAGHFATGTLLPILSRMPDVRLHSICSAGGLTAASAAERYGFESSASDYRDVLDDREVDAVIIATRHDTHAQFAAESLRAGKHVFVEKPLAMDYAQLNALVEAQAEQDRIVMPGFNRRFSPLSVAVRDFFANRSGPVEILYRINAGSLPDHSWYQDTEEGGWRIVSEGCHFVDLAQFLAGSVPKYVHAEVVGGQIPGGQRDQCAVTMRMADGSLAMILYVGNGDPGFEKERIEVFGQGRSAVIHNFQGAELWTNGKRKNLRRGGKGHSEELTSFVQAVRNGLHSPLPFKQAVSATLATFLITESIRTSESRAISDLSLDSEYLEPSIG